MAAAAAMSAPRDLRQRLMSEHCLWIDPFTAAYLQRAAGREAAEVQFIAACARTGRSAFHVLPAAALRGR